MKGILLLHGCRNVKLIASYGPTSWERFKVSVCQFLDFFDQVKLQNLEMNKQKVTNLELEATLATVVVVCHL